MSVKPENIKVVCFDLGGVVIRICRTWPQGCAAAGLDVRTQHDRDRTAERRTQTVVDYQCGRIDCVTFATQISEIIEGEYSAEEIMAVHHAWLIDSYAGIEDIVNRLNTAGYHTACLSNTNHAHWIRMDEFPAVGKLQTRLASHELGLHKPDTEIYIAAQDAFGCEPHEIIFFDDLPENVKAAEATGWNAVQIDHAGNTSAQVRQGLSRYDIEV